MSEQCTRCKLKPIHARDGALSNDWLLHRPEQALGELTGATRASVKAKAMLLRMVVAVYARFATDCRRSFNDCTNAGLSLKGVLSNPSIS